MEESKVIEGNKLIAVFMGAEMIAPIGHTMRGVKFSKETHGLWVHAATDLQYHSSWDWLMPCVKKINDICSEKGGELSNHSRDQEHLGNPLDNPLHWKSWSYHHVTLTTDINHVWTACVQFVEWFNTQSSNTENK